MRFGLCFIKKPTDCSSGEARHNLLGLSYDSLSFTIHLKKFFLLNVLGVPFIFYGNKF